MKLHVPMSVGSIKYAGEIEEGDDLAETAKTVYKAAGNLRVVACIAGGEATSRRLKAAHECAFDARLVPLRGDDLA